MKLVSVALSLILTFGLAACSNDADQAPADPHRPDDQGAGQVTNRIAIPAAVRQNLGITFARVERRPVQQTLRFPGEFELRPESRREFRVMAPGRVNLHVKQFQSIEPGTLLLTLDSPQWRELQHEAVEAEGQIKVAQAALDVAGAQRVETEQAATFLRQRIAGLAESQLRNVELEAQLAELENRLPRLQTEIEAKRVELEEAREHYRSRLNTLASLVGMSVTVLMEPVGDSLGEPEHTSHPRWRTLGHLEIRADIGGIVDTVDVTDGGWIETGGLALSIVDPSAIRFRAHSLQSDMGRLQDGQRALIVPPQGGSFDMQAVIEATLTVGFRGSPEERTIPLYAIPSAQPSWAKPGVSAFLEVFVGGSAQPELAIPASAVVRDGLVPLIFRRDPSNSDAVIRLEADLGTSDGRWIVVNSGVRENDEVVLDGAYQLMLASSGTSAKGGHFHADGTFHAGEDEK
jgi:multidrug efflux pump subunit AcrA (membrane-fusion protein)